MTAPVRAAMEQWMDHILRYSRRDQLSVNLALAQHSVPTRHLEGSNRESEFHAWPPVSPALGRRAEKNHEAFAHAVRAPLLRLRALERDTADLIEAHKLAATKRDALIEKLSKQARQTERERNLALKERDKARAQVVALRSRVTRLRGRLAAVRATGDGAGPAGRGSTAPSGADTRAREGAARRGLRSLAARPTPRRLARRLPGPVKRRLHGYARQAEGQGSPRGGRRNTVG
jgi:hypothetical protein